MTKKLETPLEIQFKEQSISMTKISTFLTVAIFFTISQCHATEFELVQVAMALTSNADVQKEIEVSKEQSQDLEERRSTLQRENAIAMAKVLGKEGAAKKESVASLKEKISKEYDELLDNVLLTSQKTRLLELARQQLQSQFLFSSGLLSDNPLIEIPQAEKAELGNIAKRLKEEAGNLSRKHAKELRQLLLERDEKIKSIIGKEKSAEYEKLFGEPHSRLLNDFIFQRKIIKRKFTKDFLDDVRKKAQLSKKKNGMKEKDTIDGKPVIRVDRSKQIKFDDDLDMVRSAYTLLARPDIKVALELTPQQLQKFEQSHKSVYVKYSKARRKLRVNYADENKQREKLQLRKTLAGDFRTFLEGMLSNVQLQRLFQISRQILAFSELPTNGLLSKDSQLKLAAEKKSELKAFDAEIEKRILELAKDQQNDRKKLLAKRDRDILRLLNDESRKEYKELFGAPFPQFLEGYMYQMSPAH